MIIFNTCRLYNPSTRAFACYVCAGGQSASWLFWRAPPRGAKVGGQEVGGLGSSNSVHPGHGWMDDWFLFNLKSSLI